VVEVLIPLDADDTLCPAGRIRQPVFCSTAAPELPDGKSWDDPSRGGRRSHIANGGQITPPGFAASVRVGRCLGRQLDLERQFRAARRRQSFHGALTLKPAVLGAADASRQRRISRAAKASPLRKRPQPGGGVTAPPGHTPRR